MTIRSVLNRMLGKQEPEAVAAAPVEAAPDPRGAPGTRVHHEYFVYEPGADGLCGWLCRVYAQNGAVNEKEGNAVDAEAAKNAALTYAALTKRALRGDA